jgi:hypothetical protein
MMEEVVKLADDGALVLRKVEGTGEEALLCRQTPGSAASSQRSLGSRCDRDPGNDGAARSGIREW